MSQTPRLHTILPVLLLHLVFLDLLFQTYQSTLSAAQNATGWFSPQCDGASLYLSKVNGLPPGQKLNLMMIHNGLSWEIRRLHEGDFWEDVYAERCFSAGKCEAATHAKIWLDKGKAKDKHVSGRYDVYIGGQHFEGQFLLKYRKQDSRCE
jgi:hypothetical protein